MDSHSSRFFFFSFFFFFYLGFTATSRIFNLYRDKRGYQENSFLISSQKHMVWVFI